MDAVETVGAIDSMVMNLKQLVDSVKIAVESAVAENWHVFTEPLEIIYATKQNVLCKTDLTIPVLEMLLNYEVLEADFLHSYVFVKVVCITLIGGEHRAVEPV